MSAEPRRILIGEDDDRVAAFVANGLRENGFDPTVVTDGAAALEGALSGEFDLLLVDLGLPVLDGLTVLGILRATGSELPVVMLTGGAEHEDAVAGLEADADDYVRKPFRFEELLARVRLRLRHDELVGELPLVIRSGELSLDLRTRRAAVGDRVVELTSREFALLELFVQQAGRVLTREQLLRHVWGIDFDTGSNVVDVYVRYLRRKLGAEWIETVRGMGYRLMPPEPPDG